MFLLVKINWWNKNWFIRCDISSCTPPMLHFLRIRDNPKFHYCQTYNRTLAINWHTGKLQSIIMTRLQAQKSQPWGYTTTSPVSHTFTCFSFITKSYFINITSFFIIYLNSQFSLSFDFVRDHINSSIN